MLTPQDIEAELSYAYLHAVASRVGAACQVATRSHDNVGIDAMLTLRRDFGPRAVLTDVTLHVQLKATITPPTKEATGRLGYWLSDIAEYDRLRAPTSMPPRLLCVLFLPSDHARWLDHGPEQLAMRRCAYWLSLLDAPESGNQTGQTVYFPEGQALCPDGLLALFTRVARQERLSYVS